MAKKMFSGDFFGGGAAFLFFVSVFVQTLNGQSGITLLPGAISILGMAAGAGIAIMNFFRREHSEAEKKHDPPVIGLVFAAASGIFIAMLFAGARCFLVNAQVSVTVLQNLLPTARYSPDMLYL